LILCHCIFILASKENTVLDKTVCLTCGTLEAEIRRLVDRGVFDFDVFPVEELFLHDPFDAKRCIQGVFKTFRANRYRPIVICTDEYVNLSRICKEFDIPRLGGKTASSIILGETVAQELHQAGSLTLLPAVFQGDLYRLMDEINEMKNGLRSGQPHLPGYGDRQSSF
jgi:hypothetical protein